MHLPNDSIFKGGYNLKSFTITDYPLTTTD